MKVPVLYLIFKRREQTLQSFAPIKAYKPSKLYIAADGPRENVQGEEEECEATRKGVLDLIDWDCEVKTLFRNKNVGCSEAVYGGISWFFEHEEFGIINEDDVVLSPDFFHFCENCRLFIHMIPVERVTFLLVYVKSQSILTITLCIISIYQQMQRLS